MEHLPFNKILGLDIHGIINAHPAFFAAMTQSFIKDGWQIHVLTGSHIEESNIKEELANYGIVYTHLFSIADYHRENKTDGMWYDKNGDPWVSDEDWDRTKAEYCKRNNISFCIDDTARYANYFETPFGYMSIQMNNKKPNKYLGFIIAMFDARSKKRKEESQKPSDNKTIIWLNNKISWFFSPKTKLGKERE